MDASHDSSTTPASSLRQSSLSRRQALRLGVAALAAGAAAPLLARSAEAAPIVGQGPARVQQMGSTVNVTYWGSFSGNLGEAEQAMVKRFNESQSDVQVEYQFQGSYEDTAQKLTAALQARQAPDISLLSDVWWFKFYLSRTLLPLDSLMTQHGVDSTDYVDSLINEGVRKGQTVWIPFARSTPIFYYNKQAWSEAGLPDRGPETWDEFLTWVPSLVQKDGSGNVTRYAFAHPGAASYIAWLFQGVAWQYGGSYSDPDFTIRIAEEPVNAAGEFYRSSVVDGWASTPANIDPDFRGGIAAAVMGSTAGLAGHEANATFPVGTAFLPQGPAGFGCSTGGSGLSVINVQGASAEKQEAGFKFIAFATSTEQTAIWSQSTGYMPVRKSAIEGPMQAFYATRPNFLTTVNQLPYTRAQDAARAFIPNGDQIIGKGLERIVISKEAPATVWPDIKATLERESASVVRQLRAVEG